MAGPLAILGIYLGKALIDKALAPKKKAHYEPTFQIGGGGSGGGRNPSFRASQPQQSVVSSAFAGGSRDTLDRYLDSRDNRVPARPPDPTSELTFSEDPQWGSNLMDNPVMRAFLGMY